MTDPHQRRFQFGIRHLLLATAAVAVVAGASAPLMRDWSTSQWLYLGLWLGTITCSVVIPVLAVMSSKRKEMRNLGTPRWILRQSTGWNNWSASFCVTVMVVGSVILLIGLVVNTSSYDPSRESSSGSSQLAFLLWLFFVFWPIHFGFQAWYRSSPLIVGENGVFIAIGFAPWKNIACSYEPGGKPVPLLLKLGRHVIQLHPLPELEREIADYLLARCRPWDGPDRPSG